jgi:hypothetical protein
MDHLRNLGNQISIRLQPDKDGYMGRECPVTQCLGYFKVTPGTGIKVAAPCICPYCGHNGPAKTFYTKEQIAYAKSLAMRKITDAFRADLKSLEFDHKPSGGFGIGMSLKLQPSSPRPIRYYREKQLETEVVCDRCTLRYAIYGVFGWCPDCGVHNSLQILTKNLDLARKELALAATTDAELAAHLVGDALENVVAAFDGFGREICSQKAADITFQNLLAARRKVQETFAVDIADGLPPDDWDRACRAFQKRHLLAHKMGVIDAEYIKKANDPAAVAGRKINVTPHEVEAAIGIVEAMGRRLFDGIISAKL